MQNKKKTKKNKKQNKSNLEIQIEKRELLHYIYT